jgi:ribosomal protein S18 acetylase RimI-like enzyme
MRHKCEVVAYQLIPAAPEDQVWLEQLRRAVYHELFVATWGGWDEARHMRHCAECWERGGIFCIEVDGVRVGMIQLFDQPDAIEVGEIQVQPAYQGRGIGTRLLSDIIRRAHARGKKVSLSTGLQNHRAYQLYQRLGFRQVAQTDTHNHMACEPRSQGLSA